MTGEKRVELSIGRLTSRPVRRLGLYLAQDIKGRVDLRMDCGDGGLHWRLLSVTPTGKVELARCIPENLGIQVDHAGVVLVEGR